MRTATLAIQCGLYAAVCILALIEFHRLSRQVSFRRWSRARRLLEQLPFEGWRVLFPVVNAEEFEVGVFEFTRGVSVRLLAPLGAFRVMGLASSLLGFVSVALNFAWLHSDHGLLDLDPGGLARTAAHRSAVAVAVAVATSATSAALRGALRDRVRDQLDGLASLERVAQSRWTDVRSK